MTAYSALLREIRLDAPFVPPPSAGIELTFGGKLGLTYREMLPPGMDYLEAAEFAVGEAPSKRSQQKYQEWMMRTREVTSARLKHEAHYPVPDDAPPTADTNIYRIREIQEQQKARKKKHLEDSAKAHFGHLDDKGITHFTGEDLAAWQLKQYTQWKSVEAEKTAFEEQLRLEEWGEQTENMELSDPRLAEAVFREEIFEPGSSERTVKRFSANLPARPTLRDTAGRLFSSASTHSSTPSAQGKMGAVLPPSAAGGQGSSMSSLSAKARRRRSSAKPVQEEILDEVAV